ncbi:MAG TPA: hypothetical protein VK489_08150 [Ferruginibacter sp.]|nr:hypothetical protein [Ferruginibacter sp.]
MAYYYPNLFVKATAIELHYWFNDKSHNMDALLQNKCEAEFLNLIKAIASSLGEDIIIETEPIGEGGLRRWFRVIRKSENRTGIITAAIITSIVTTLIVTPIGSVITKVADHLIENAFEDKEDKAIEKKGKELDNEKKEAEIKNINLDIEIKEKQLEKNNTVIKRRSNFYDTLSKYPKLTKISFSLQDENKKNIIGDFTVEKNEFNKYIVVSDELEPKEINDAIIEIISPVLKKGNYRWRGIYDGASILFSMKSNEFKTLVQTGAVEFKNGTSIKCLLEIKRKINNEGIEEITEYNILDVSEYFNNDTPAQGIEVKPKKKKPKIVKNPTQLDLF